MTAELAALIDGLVQRAPGKTSLQAEAELDRLIEEWPEDRRELEDYYEMIELARTA